ncbi:riboflavin synthase subunit alpha [Cohnella kolymensis]|uniref:Riboflavin synthase n=1 Tax=Cohnella kolymensis TaxID=1590652 RepID=A0ABR5A1F2_9BACL|nr:riboflavin synthase [Cohnella kolymensis]KIL34879.1 riboflavin synthase subunit alpha [Cohnella kolymensis]
MFTGLIEEMGVLRSVQRRGEAMIITIQASKVTEDVKMGDSISVNGVCLTVVGFDRQSFTVDVMPETFRHTNLRSISPGSTVNLERAMMAGGRFGGHLVQGHVDGTGVIRSRTAEANAVVFKIAPHDGQLLRSIVPQGSVTLDGISLTVVTVDREADSFTVSIIPHTLRETILQHKYPGETLNIECDILGKYVDHLLSLREGSAPGGMTGAGGLSESVLRANGFM